MFVSTYTLLYLGWINISTMNNVLEYIDRIKFVFLPLIFKCFSRYLAYVASSKLCVDCRCPGEIQNPSVSPMTHVYSIRPINCINRFNIANSIVILVTWNWFTILCRSVLGWSRAERDQSFSIILSNIISNNFRIMLFNKLIWAYNCNDYSPTYNFE